MAEEIESKLSITQETRIEDVLALCRSLAGGAEEKHIRMQARYFDTADGALRKVRLAYRTRAENGKWVAALKGSGEAADGVHRRLEVEADVAHGEPDLSVFLAGEGRTLALPFVGRDLIAIVETEFDRIAMTFTCEGAVIEAAVDLGEIRANGKVDAIRELELELKSGSLEALAALTDKLKRRLGLTAEDRSKFARGLALYQ